MVRENFNIYVEIPNLWSRDDKDKDLIAAQESPLLKNDFLDNYKNENVVIHLYPGTSIASLCLAQPLVSTKKRQVGSFNFSLSHIGNVTD